MFYYGLDWTFTAIIIPCMILSLWASASLQRNYRKYSKQMSMRRITGAEAAQRVLNNHGIHNVRIERIKGNLTDHFDPKAKVIRLSDGVYDSISTAAIGVACHEAGHAVQYAQNYGPIRFRAAIIPATNLGSKMAMPLILLGLILSSFANFTSISTYIIYFGIACFSLSFIFQLITLPVEFNASRRAIQTIEDANILTEEEQIGAKRTLRSAAMTYLVATIAALGQVLRLIVLFGRRKK